MATWRRDKGSHNPDEVVVHVARVSEGTGAG